MCGEYGGGGGGNGWNGGTNTNNNNKKHPRQVLSQCILPVICFTVFNLFSLTFKRRRVSGDFLNALAVRSSLWGLSSCLGLSIGGQFIQKNRKNTTIQKSQQQKQAGRKKDKKYCVRLGYFLIYEPTTTRWELNANAKSRSLIVDRLIARSPDP